MIFCILDTETTGLKPGYHEVIQVAALICDKNLKEIDRVSFKINPQKIERASKKALEINKYNPKTWSPDFFTKVKYLKYLNRFISKYASDEIIMAGQNIKFDYKFLKAEYEQCDVPFPFSTITLDLMDVAKLWSSFRNTRLKKYSLDYLVKFTNQVNDNPHDAEADAEVTLDVLKWFVKDLKKGTKHERKRINKRTALKV